MAFLPKKGGLQEVNRVVLITPDQISPNPDQPRQYFDPQGLSELADSIRIHGILQPLTVRRRATAGRFELVAGERRLRAAQLCGLNEVPCIILDIKREASCLLSLIENIQRRDLDFLEEAQALERLIGLYGLSQEEAAAQVGKSQSAVANKLRLLRLPEDVLDLLRKNGASERHARALLRLPDEESQMEAARMLVEQGFTVARTEDYVHAYLETLYAPPALPAASSVGAEGDEVSEAQSPDPRAARPPRRKPNFLIRDVRFFLNSIQKGLDMMNSAGVAAHCDKEEVEDGILLTIKIPKGSASAV